MAKDPYREIAEQHKQPLEKVKANEIEETAPEGLQRPVKQKEKKRHYPLLTVLLAFFIASPFIAVYAFKDDTPESNEKVTQKADTVLENEKEDTE